MRLLIYLLALLSGFSVAEAARAEVEPASSVAQTAIAVAETLSAQVKDDAVRTGEFRNPDDSARDLGDADAVLLEPTPVTRFDLSLQ